jgi:predicted MFS family arabinose efflux permease
MKRNLKQIGIWTAVFAAVAWSIYDWIVVDQGPAYFAADWRRIALLAIITIVGSMATLAFMSLPPAVQQRLSITSFAAGAVLSTAACGYTVWQFFRMYAFLREMNARWLVLAVVLASAIVTYFVWFMFLRYLRKTARHNHNATICL